MELRALQQHVKDQAALPADSSGGRAAEQTQAAQAEAARTASKAAYKSGKRLFLQKRKTEKVRSVKNASQFETHFDISGRGARSIKTRKMALKTKTKPASKPTLLEATSSVQRGRQKAVREAVQKITTPSIQKLGELTSNFGRFIASAVSTGVSALTVMGSAGILVVSLLFLGAIAGIVASPFGIFLAGENGQPNACSVAEAIGIVQADFNSQLAALQTGAYDRISIVGSLPEWVEVLAVFVARTTGGESSTDVATLTPEKVDVLKAVFWDMTTLTSVVTDVETDDGSTQHVLEITITHMTAEEMCTSYSFTNAQNAALTELLQYRVDMAELTGDLLVTNADAQALLAHLPEDLSPQRRAVVTTACQLVGKINYFWGGKSLALGWDPRWGQLMQVTAAGSHTTGTWRSFGMDCSGFVTWVFFNASGGTYILGSGGGTGSQHTACTSISADQAQPGDIVFYGDDSHVGIVGGRDANGNLFIIHCASGYDTVVITGQGNFSVFARPSYLF